MLYRLSAVTEHYRIPKERRLLRLQLRTMIVKVPLVIQEALLVFFQVLRNKNPWFMANCHVVDAHVKSLGSFRSTGVV